MKKKYYDVGTFIYTRNFKCGLETIAAIGVATAVASLGTGIAQAETNRSAQESANRQNVLLNKIALEQQERLFHEGNVFNSQEAEKARQFNSDEAAINRQWQSEQADRQLQKAMDWFEKYSSPSSQVQQYLDAGLHPSTLAGNTNGYSPSFSLPSGSAASGVSSFAASAPSVPLGRVEPANLNLGNLFNDSADLITKSLGIKASEVDISGKITDNQFKAALHNADLRVKGAMFDKLHADINLDMTKLAETEHNINLIDKNISYLDTEITNINADTANKRLDEFFHSQQYELLLNKMKQDYQIDRQVADAQLKYFAAKVLESHGNAASAVAMARYYNSLESLTENNRNQIKAYTHLLEQEGGIANTQNYLDTLFGYKERQKNFEISEQAYEKARYENTTLFRLINGGRGVATSFGGAFMNYYGAKGLVK